MLTKDQPAPSFSTPDQDSNTICLSDFANKKNVVLYFYPKDDTSGCTIEAQQFSEIKSQFDEADTVILGVSKDSIESHQAFIKKFDLKVSLLADTEGQLCNDYDVWQDKGSDGEVKMGIVRSTFIINTQGIIKSAEYGVKADGHAEKVLAFVKSL